MAEHMLTTLDNPYNPFTQYEDWYSYDQRLGYGTIEFLARIVKTSDELSEPDQSQAIEDAIDEIVFYNVSGMHMKIGPTDVPRALSSQQNTPRS